MTPPARGRVEGLEEGAKVAEDVAIDAYSQLALRIAAAIRALKEKP